MGNKQLLEIPKWSGGCVFSVALSRVYLAKLPAQLDPPLHVIPHAQRLVGARGYLRAFVITGSRMPLPSAIMRLLLLH